MKNKLLQMLKRLSLYFATGLLLQAFLINTLLASNHEKRIAKKEHEVMFVTQKVSGKVTSAEGESLPGVNIIEKGTTNGAVTDVEGNYSIEVTEGATLVFSFIGFAAQEIQVGNQSVINVTLASDIKTLQEVVVVGYGTVAKRDLTGSVASVSGKTIANTPVPNIAQAMQGKLAGVNVTTQDGRPGADVAIRVRGGNSISQSNQPLVVIDGFPGGNLSDVPPDQVESIDVLKDASSTAIYGARGANGVILVTTKRGKSGKTVVTYNSYVKFNTPTKYMKALAPYDYLTYVWANAAANGAAFQTPFEKLYGIGAGSTPDNNPGGIDNYRNMSTDDIQRKVYHQSVTWNHDLTLSGGTDKTKVLLSASYMNDQGMKINSYYKRANIYFKLSHQLSEKVSFDLNTRYINSQTFGNDGVSSGMGSLLSSSYQFRPIATQHILGDLGALQGTNIDQYGKNVMWDLYSPDVRAKDISNLDIASTLRSVANVDWKIAKGLKFDTYLTLNKNFTQRRYWSGAFYNGYVDANGNKSEAGKVDDFRKGDDWSTRWTNTLNYELNLGDASKINLMAGQEVSNLGGADLRIKAGPFPSNYDMSSAFGLIGQYDQTALASGGTVGSMTISSPVTTPQRTLSYFGRANYSFNDRILATFTFRTDASSKFAKGHQRGYFPAGAIAWRLSDEPFMKNLAIFDDFKLRASYGSVGNDGIPVSQTFYSWTGVSTQNLQYDINKKPQPGYDYLNTAVLPNPNLKWETTVTRNIGTDFSVFNGRLSGTVDVYWNSTVNVLMQTTNPAVTGFTTTFDNIGNTSNKGVEVTLSGTVLQTSDWKITAGGNINFNRNRIDKLADNVNPLYSATWNGTQTYPAYDYTLQVGQPIGLVRGYVYQGFYTPDDFDYAGGVYTLKAGEADLTTVSVGSVVHGMTTDKPATQTAYPGLPKYKDMNGDGVIDDKDVTVIGRMTPKSTGGFNINVSYKNIDLGMFFNWSYGNQIYNANKLASMYGPKEQGVYENKLAIMSNSYKIYDVIDGQLVRLKTPDDFNNANAHATLPLAYNESGVTNTLGIEDGSFLRLNTFNLGYTLPKSLIAKAKLQSLRIYGSVYNLLTITHYSGLDPEVNTNAATNANSAANLAGYPTTGLDFGTYPRARSFVVGLNLSF